MSPIAEQWPSSRPDHLRPDKLLEDLSGFIIIQHCGASKANQYHLSGFNLDHGTDLAMSLDSVHARAGQQGTLLFGG